MTYYYNVNETVGLKLRQCLDKRYLRIVAYSIYRTYKIQISMPQWIFIQ